MCAAIEMFLVQAAPSPRIQIHIIKRVSARLMVVFVVLLLLFTDIVLLSDWRNVC